MLWPAWAPALSGRQRPPVRWMAGFVCLVGGLLALCLTGCQREARAGRVADAAPPQAGVCCKAPVWLAVSLGGALLRSDDGGNAWHAQPLGEDVQLRNLAKVGEHSLLALGTQGAMFRSADDGEHWVAVADGLTQDTLLGVHRCGPACLLVTGMNGAVLKSTDGGERWRLLASRTASHRGLATAQTRPAGVEMTTPEVRKWAAGEHANTSTARAALVMGATRPQGQAHVPSSSSMQVDAWALSVDAFGQVWRVGWDGVVQTLDASSEAWVPVPDARRQRVLAGMGDVRGGALLVKRANAELGMAMNGGAPAAW